MPTERRDEPGGRVNAGRGAIGARAKLSVGRLVVLFCGQAIWGGAAELPPEQVEFFEAKIRPILVEACYKCHSVELGKSKADLLLDSRDALRKGGASGAAIVPGRPDESLLIQAVRYKDEDLQMPPADEGGKLADEQIALLEEWVRMGAPDPRTGGKPHPMDMAAARAHWAFQPVVKPAVPGGLLQADKAGVRAGGREAHAIDAFVRAKLSEQGLSHAPEADKRTLLRRVTYDLTGLPPTPEEMDAFLQDDAADAYARVVERLLASPHYGERWGRHWLDVARFADTKGYLAGNVERRYPFSHTYRDYVIRAFNEDKPFDRFVVEQIAADHLPLGEDKSALAALGFLTLGRRFLNNQNDIIDDRIDVVTRGFMGLTVACARCHDHKFDPIPTKDYYSLHGVFASSEEPAEKPLLGPLVESAAYREFQRKSAEIEGKIKAREAEEVAKFLATARSRTGDYLLAAYDAQRLKAGEKLEVFAGGRKLNVEVLRRWQALLGAEEKLQVHGAVLGPWRALARLGAEMQDEMAFAERARELIAGWEKPAAGGAGGEEANELVARALAARENPVRSLKDAAEVYNGLFAALEPALAGATEAEAKSGDDAIAAATRQVRALAFGEDAPANVKPEEVATMIRREINNKTAGLKRELEALNWTEPGAPLRAMALVDKAKPANSRVLLRGNPANRGPEVPRQFLEVVAGEKRLPFERGSGRLELAEQIASPANPLTARVFVNRVWGWHFGQPLVRTSSDFGVRTAAPVHRELLDWLAASFVEGGWAVKNLHRWIVLSATYRQSSDAEAAALAADPENERWHRFNRRRLELESLRDTLLAVAGRLDVTAGGLPEDLTREPFSRRRTVYGFIDRQNLPGMFRTFDFPNPDVSSAGRFATTVPQQALFLLNSGFVAEQARALAARTENGAGGRPAEGVRTLYRAVYQREPDAEELAWAEAFLQLPPQGEPARPTAAGWEYGYGGFDAELERTRDFRPMKARQDKRATPAAKYPDAAFGYLSVTATGGHPGKSEEQASIRRWTAPTTGTVRIEATLAHATDAGDGVRGRVVSSVRGQLGEWVVRHGKAVTNFANARVEAGETIDFVVEPGASATSDGYTWAPNITYIGRGTKTTRAWNARADFAAMAKTTPRLTRREELAQVLLSSNELAFVD